MKLITEEIEQAEYIVEETNGKKNYAIKGIFMQSDIKIRMAECIQKRFFKEKL